MNERMTVPVPCSLFVPHSISMSHGQCDLSLLPGGRDVRVGGPEDENDTFPDVRNPQDIISRTEGIKGS